MRLIGLNSQTQETRGFTYRVNEVNLRIKLSGLVQLLITCHIVIRSNDESSIQTTIQDLRILCEGDRRDFRITYIALAFASFHLGPMISLHSYIYPRPLRLVQR